MPGYCKDRAELARWLASADIYVSGMADETFGVSIVEAQASGLPVVGVAAGAMIDRVTDATGRLGPVGDAAAMARNILAVWNGDRRAMAERGADACAPIQLGQQHGGAVQPRLSGRVRAGVPSRLALRRRLRQSRPDQEYRGHGRALCQAGAGQPGIARVLAHNPSAFTYYGTQTYLVGEREIAVIDPGPDLPEHLDALERAIGGRRVAAIMCTHTHRDHSPAARPLAERTGAPIIGCAPLALETVGPRADASFDGDYAPDRVLEDGEAIEVDGKPIDRGGDAGPHVQPLCFAYGDALFSGDHVMGWSTTVVVPPDGDMAAYMPSLDKLRQRDDRIYYPAHGPAVTNPQQYVAAPDGPPDAAREADPEAGRRAAAADPGHRRQRLSGARPAAACRGRRLGARASSGPRAARAR